MTKNKPSLRRRVLKEPPASYGGEIVLYQAPDGSVKLDVRLERDTIWLSQKQMALLFDTERSVITKHLRNIFQSGELEEKSNVQKMHIPGSDKPVAFYSLDAILSVGYRVNSNEAGLESLICRALTGSDCVPRPAGTPAFVAETPAPYGGVGWLPGDPADYDREYCVDLVQLRSFLHSTQPDVAEALDLGSDSPTRRKFLARLQGEVSKRGVVDVLRNGLQHGPHRIELFYATPSPGNEKARALFEQNRFTVTRQLRYSSDETQRALDLVLFINGLPVFTFELKNRLTKQTVHDAIEQYKRDRNKRNYAALLKGMTTPSG